MIVVRTLQYLIKQKQCTHLSCFFASAKTKSTCFLFYAYTVYHIKYYKYLKLIIHTYSSIKFVVTNHANYITTIEQDISTMTHQKQFSQKYLLIPSISVLFIHDIIVNNKVALLSQKPVQYVNLHTIYQKIYKQIFKHLLYQNISYLMYHVSTCATLRLLSQRREKQKNKENLKTKQNNFQLYLCVSKPCVKSLKCLAQIVTVIVISWYINKSFLMFNADFHTFVNITCLNVNVIASVINQPPKQHDVWLRFVYGIMNPPRGHTHPQ
eukprot:TRINITY_DN20009_c0_g1_i1.p1 TRINITY_DN20009_c0_g1~~TRINITY_DN20009_c0_g1_i1.p1  ORF type:complete len:267 (-),score=-29.16 TRINITY_DN20009_c0_g1_i1:267-1067(-)